MPKKISFIVPVYNAQNYLSECLDSIIIQTIPFEIICVDDGSTDNSLQILLNYKNKCDNLKIIRQKNQGSSVARNRAIEEVTGDYISFIDADDKIASTWGSDAFDTIQRYNPDLIIFNGLVLDEINNCTYPFYDDAIIQKLPENGNIIRLNGINNLTYFLLEPSIAKRVYATNLLRRISAKMPAGLIYEDVPLHFEIGLATRNIVLDKTVKYFYRISQSPSNTKDNSEKRFHIIKIHQIILELLKKHKALDYVYIAFLNSLVKMSWWCQSMAIDKKIKLKIKHGVREMVASLDEHHIIDFLTSPQIDDGSKKKLYALLHNIPLHYAKKIPLKILRTNTIKPLFKIISFFNK